MSYSFWAIVSFFVMSCFYVFSLEEHKIERRVHLLILLSLLIFSLFVLTYRGFGLDVENYRSYYYQSVEYSVEPLYEFVMKVFRYVGASFETFYFFLYVIALSLYYYSFDKVGNSAKLWFIFLSLYYFTYFDVTRAFIASAILLASLKLLSEGKFIRFIVFSVFGVLTHYSFLIVILLYFLLAFKLTGLTFLVLLVTAISGGVLIKPFLFGLYEAGAFYGTKLEVFRTALRYIFEHVSLKGDYFNSVHEFLWLFIVLYVPVLSALVSVFTIGRYSEYNSKFLQYLVKFNAFGVILSSFLLSLGGIVMAARVNQMLSIGLPLLIVVSCIGTERVDWKSGAGWRYIAVASTIFIIGLIPFSYIARVYMPGAMLYYGKVF